MILPICLYGHPALRNETQDVEKDYPNLKELIANMYDTMYNAEGVGLAAPQVGLSLRLLVIDADVLADDYPECKDFKMTMINPEIIEESDDSVTHAEGCLSLPGVSEKVERAKTITVTYQDENFVEHTQSFDGFVARVIQHEYDHLEGRMFIDAISPIRKQLNRGRLNNIVKGAVRTSYRVKTATR